MPINGYFDQIFANSGDKTAVPDPTQGSGTVSYQQGFPVGYSTPVGSGGFNFPRYQHNQILYDVTSAIQNWQQNTIAPFITSTMNGGSAYTYPMYAMVLSGGVAYVSNTNGNADTPPSSKWNIMPISAATSNTYTGGTTTGSANAQLLASLSPSSGFSLSSPGDTIICTAGFTNTSAATLAITSPSISATVIQKNSSTGLTGLTGGEIVAGNIVTFTVSAGGTLVLDAGLPASLFLQKANNLSDVANAGTARTNLSAAKSGANTDITSLQGSALIFTPGGIGSPVIANNNSGSTVSLGSTAAGSNLVTTGFSNPPGGQTETTGDSLTGTYQAAQTLVNSAGASASVGLWQRTL